MISPCVRKYQNNWLFVQVQEKTNSFAIQYGTSKTVYVILQLQWFLSMSKQQINTAWKIPLFQTIPSIPWSEHNLYAQFHIIWRCVHEKCIAAKKQHHNIHTGKLSCRHLPSTFSNRRHKTMHSSGMMPRQVTLPFKAHCANAGDHSPDFHGFQYSEGRFFTFPWFPRYVYQISCLFVVASLRSKMLGQLRQFIWREKILQSTYIAR